MSGRDRPIEDYGLISDCRSWALVCIDGGIDWCNFNQADAHPVLSGILDRERGGRFRLAPVDPDASSSRRYVEDTNVLETRFETEDGIVVLTDALVVGERSSPTHPVRVQPHDQLVRRIRCESGTVRVRFNLDPRFDYGLTSPRLRLDDEHRAVAYGAGDAIIAHSDVPLVQRDWHSCEAEATLRPGESWYVSLRYVLPHHLTDRSADPCGDLEQRLQDTISFWRSWSERCTYRGPYREQVVRSALVLKGLTDAETGAIVAAPTTSLPEDPGGERNWDYRYVWIRDAAMHLEALFGLGYRDEAHAFVRYLERTTAGTADDLQVLYGPRGQRLLPELELRELTGYRGSRPIRIGNAAAGQYQTDAYGQLLDTAWRYREHGGELGVEFRHLLRDTAQILQQRWDEPDHGIWEVRTARERFVSSQLFAWIGLDRAVRLAEEIDLPDVEDYERLGRRIRKEILERGVDPTTGGFARSLSTGAGTDASNLLLPLQGLIDPGDERVSAMVKAVRGQLGVGEDGGLLLRYLDADGLAGGEGAFVICSFWLVSVLAARGEIAEATRVFERTAGHANDLGLLAEQIDPATGSLLGNFPQAISHAGLVDAALQLEAARERFSPGDEESRRPAPWASGGSDLDESPQQAPQQTPEPEAR